MNKKLKNSSFYRITILSFILNLFHFGVFAQEEILTNLGQKDDFIYNNGKIGIGITNPTASLHINNGNDTYGAILANSTEKSFGLFTKSLSRIPNTETFRLGLKYNQNENNGFISFYRGGSAEGGFLGFSTFGIERMRILANGRVGIGTSITGTHRLAVEGTIGAREVKVESSGWSDFVFYDNYPLMKLKDLEEYILKHEHLPDIPSEKEILANGIELGKMDSKLLQKIEELTLYIIQQQKEIIDLKTIELKLKDQLDNQLIVLEKLDSLLKRIEILESNQNN